MGTFFKLFDCESRGANHDYEERFRWFFVIREPDGTLQIISQAHVEKRVAEALRTTSNEDAVIYLARLLGCSLERDAYDAFIEDIGLPFALAVFYDNSALTSEGLTDFEGTKKANFPKYRFFKFASFLDLLRPGEIRWREQTELESERLVSAGLDRFQAEGLRGRAALLSRWIRQPSHSAFSEKKSRQSKLILQRQAFLLTKDDVPAAEVAELLDNAGFKPGRKYHSYTEWSHANRKSFESWLSAERADSRRAWHRSQSKNRR